MSGESHGEDGERLATESTENTEGMATENTKNTDDLATEDTENTKGSYKGHKEYENLGRIETASRVHQESGLVRTVLRLLSGVATCRGPVLGTR